jgi:hypothetical protein
MSVQKKWECSFYEDIELENPITIISLGDVWYGEEKEKTIYLRNDENTIVRDIIFQTDREDVVITGPMSMVPYGVELVMIKWKPKEDSLGLNIDIKIKGTLVYR